MKQMVIVLRSSNIANMIRKKAEKRGVFVKVMHTPKEISSRGCSYLVRFEEKYLSFILALIYKMEILDYKIFYEIKENKKIKFMSYN